MGIINQYSRLQHHRLTNTGVLFTVPGSEDFTDGSWISTDLRRGEFGIQMTDDRVFVRTDNGILELSATSGPSALWERVGDDIVAKDSGASPIAPPNILPPTNADCNLGSLDYSWQNIYLSKSIICNNGSPFSGVQIDFEPFAPNSFLITNDNGGFANEYVYMTPNNVAIGSQDSTNLATTQYTSGSQSYSHLVVSDNGMSLALLPADNYILNYVQDGAVESYMINQKTGFSFTTADVNLVGATLTCGSFAGTGSITAVAGMIIFNSMTGKHQGYDGATWNDLY